jgi:hypothetical protein
MVKSSSSSPKAIHNKIGSQASTTLTVSPMLLMLILYIYIRMTHYRLFKPIIWTCVIHQFLHTLQPRATILLCHRRATFFLCPADKIPSRAPPFFIWIIGETNFTPCEAPFPVCPIAVKLLAPCPAGALWPAPPSPLHF